MRGEKILAIIGVIVSSFTIIINLLTPITVQIIIEGNIIELTEIPNIYTAWDLMITSISCAILGSSLIYLIVEDKIQQPHPSPSIQDDWNNIVENLVNPDEKTIVTLIIARAEHCFKAS